MVDAGYRELSDDVLVEQHAIADFDLYLSFVEARDPDPAAREVLAPGLKAGLGPVVRRRSDEVRRVDARFADHPVLFHVKAHSNLVQRRNAVGAQANTRARVVVVGRLLVHRRRS